MDPFEKWKDSKAFLAEAKQNLTDNLVNKCHHFIASCLTHLTPFPCSCE